MQTGRFLTYQSRTRESAAEQVVHTAIAYLGLCSMKRLGIFLPPHGRPPRINRTIAGYVLHRAFEK